MYTSSPTCIKEVAEDEPNVSFRRRQRDVFHTVTVESMQAAQTVFFSLAKGLCAFETHTKSKIVALWAWRVP